jgi:hypothetical protein
MAIGNIMRHQKLLVGINIAETAVRDAIASSNLVVELSTRTDLIAVVVRA